MALTVDGIRIPAHVQAKGAGAIEAFVTGEKQKIGMPHPMPPLAEGEKKADRDAQWAPKLAALAEQQAKEEAAAAATVTAAPIVNPPPVARAQHRGQGTAAPSATPAANETASQIGATDAHAPSTTQGPPSK